ncbi:MAG: site-2 protease family protein, partial [Chloroflexi bacterium]|nr:site-2 protease family protein [Chloroflexota bacterium]
TEGLASEALGAFWWVNLGWGILNLLPIIPLDGGRIMSAFIGGIAPGKGMRVAHVISILLAVGVGLFALTLQAWWTAFLCGLFVMANVQGLRMLGQARGDASSPGRAGTSG